jgi:hypothetical protein
MSDYLANLARSAAGLGASLQPRRVPGALGVVSVAPAVDPDTHLMVRGEGKPAVLLSTMREPSSDMPMAKAATGAVVDEGGAAAVTAIDNAVAPQARHAAFARSAESSLLDVPVPGPRPARPTRPAMDAMAFLVTTSNEPLVAGSPLRPRLSDFGGGDERAAVPKPPPDSPVVVQEAGVALRPRIAFPPADPPMPAELKQPLLTAAPPAPQPRERQTGLTPPVDGVSEQKVPRIQGANRSGRDPRTAATGAAAGADLGVARLQRVCAGAKLSAPRSLGGGTHVSDYRAIAGVSSSIRNLLRDRMVNPTPVTIAPPDVTISGVDGMRLNLCLYLVTENGFLKNQEIPGHGAANGFSHPPLSLNLHYLLTAHGENETSVDADRQAQQILGDGMSVLHDFGILDASLLFTNPAAGDVGKPILDSSLLDEFERVKLCLQPTSLDDFAKIWTALHQSNFRLSVAYEVSVVQIESRRLRTFVPPVRVRSLTVAPLQRPEIAAVYRSAVAPGDPIGDARAPVLQQLTIEGARFAAPSTRVRLGGLEPIGVTPRSDASIQLTIPDDTYPPDAQHPVARPIPATDQLQPGPQLVQVLTERRGEAVQGGLDRGQVVTQAQVQPSNQAVFMLVPQITATDPASGPKDTILTVQGRRLFDERLYSAVLIGDTPFSPLDPQDPASPPGTVRTPTEVRVRVTGLAPNTTYALRAFVNGAASLEESFTFEVTP